MEKFIFWRPELDWPGDTLHHATIQVMARSGRELYIYNRMANEIWATLSKTVTENQMLCATVTTPRNHGYALLVAFTRLRHGECPGWEQHEGLPTYQW